MPLSEQELRCVDLASGFLSGNLGGTWTAQDYLDEVYVSEPSPEVVNQRANNRSNGSQPAYR